MSSRLEPAHLPDRGLEGAVRWLASAVLGLVAVGILWPGVFTWGVAHAAYWPVPLWARLLWPALLLVLVWTPAATWLGRVFLSRGEPLLLGPPLIPYVIMPVVAAACFWVLRVRTPLLGDGVLLSSLLGDGTLHHGFDFMAFHLHARLAQHLGVNGFLEAQRLLAATSAITGAGYLVAVAWTVRGLHRQAGDAVLGYGLLVITPVLLIFMGYTECYAQLAVCLLLFAGCLLRYLDGRGSLLASSAWFAAGVFWHLNALFLMPLLLAVALRGPARLRRVLEVVWPTLVAVILAGTFLLTVADPRTIVHEGFMSPQQGRRLLTALTGGRGLLDWRQWKDVVNLALLLVPMPLVVLGAVAMRRRYSAWQAPRARWFLAAGLWLVLIALLLNMKLGVVRDWDLLAAHSVVVSVAAMSLIRKWAPSPALLGVLWIVGLGMLVPWVGVNAMDTASTGRLLAATADLPPYPRGLMLEDLGRWRREHGDVPGAVDAYRQAAAACPGHARFHLLHGQLRCQGEEYAAAVGPLRQALQIEDDNLMAHRMLLLALARLDRPEAALLHARALAGTRVDDWEVARAHGALAEQVGTSDEAMSAYERAWALAPQQPEVMVRAGELALTEGKWPRAERGFRAVLARDASHVPARLGLAQALWGKDLEGAFPDQQGLDEVLSLLSGLSLPEVEQANLAAWQDAVRRRRDSVSAR